MSDVQTNTANVVDKPKFKDQYDNFIGGKWTAPVKGEYFDNVSPVDGANFTKIPRSTAEDVELAIDAAWKAAPEWNNSSAAFRSNLLLKIADVMEKTSKPWHVPKHGTMVRQFGKRAPPICRWP